MVSQYDSHIQLRIREGNQSGSTAMKMIWFWGFLFLPGTLHLPPLLVLVYAGSSLRSLRCVRCRDGRVPAQLALGLSASSCSQVPAVPARVLDEEGFEPGLSEVGT